MKFIQITDTHLVPKGETLHGLKPYDRLKACVEDINRCHNDAELCVITGDLAHDAVPDAYIDLRACLSELPMPVYLLAGNHDSRSQLLAAFPDISVDAHGFVQFWLDCSVCRFLMLDTVEEGKGWGSYCEKRLVWLQDALAEARDMMIKLSGLGMYDANWSADRQQFIFDEILDAFGTSRLMIGSNFPVDRLMRSYTFVIDQYRSWCKTMPEQDWQQIFAGNARRFYNLT